MAGASQTRGRRQTVSEVSGQSAVGAETLRCRRLQRVLKRLCFTSASEQLLNLVSKVPLKADEFGHTHAVSSKGCT